VALLQPPIPESDFFLTFLNEYGGVLLAWGWIITLFFVLTIAWEVYKLLKQIDYFSAIQWTFLQITVPEENAQTPKAMESFFDVIAGIHKNPDITERFFEGYTEAWFSCEIHCEANRVRYIMVIPTNHRKFFEGVIYGQYPLAEIREVEDYTQAFPIDKIEKDFDLYGTEIITVADEFYPIRTYHEYEDSLAEDDKYIDPHQALVEAYTNIREGEQFWVQILVRPKDAKVIQKWTAAGEEAIAKIAGTAKEKEKGMIIEFFHFLRNLPFAVIDALLNGPPEAEKKKDKQLRPVFTPLDQARMEGITRKVSRNGFKTKIRVVHISPPGKLVKQSAATAMGAFKQFNTFHMNSFKPDPATKTNGPNYLLKQTRRSFRKRRILLLFQIRDMWGDDSGVMMNPEELATLYHFPIKYVKAPLVQRATSGLGSAPPDIPYI